MSKRHAPFLFELFCLLADNRRGEAEVLREFLSSLGINPFDIIIVEKAGLLRVLVYFTDRILAQKARRKANTFLHGKVRFKVRKIRNESWKVKTAKNFSIFALTKRFDVVPSWRRRAYRKTSRTPIIIDSINAFGTGLHETTSFMAQLVERQAQRFQTFLDIGTGTGLLAMIALHCGAKKVVGIDFDRDAVVAARRNLKVNGFDPMQARHGNIETYHTQKPFEFVAANLITRDLIKYKRQILATVSRGGFLAISGIMIENAPLVRKAFHARRLRCIKICKGEQWVAFLYQKAL
ncbi:MAG TPA: 50S ribosomal protein L11 methyltransferase [Candidatus Omnitrophota bacterium]|nr:50S ribosomal protein L11 methyltransferase [Candidatus Omnitrophota bacterium]HQL41263.1 50S ribosomal protein L11 methyltransferase [Candidatus Omnitrophota bacterium]